MPVSAEGGAGVAVVVVVGVILSATGKALNHFMIVVAHTDGITRTRTPPTSRSDHSKPGSLGVEGPGGMTCIAASTAECP